MANTGRLLKRQVDRNPGSPTYGQTRMVDAGIDVEACPLPTRYYSAAVTGNVTRNDCPTGQYGTTVPFTIPAQAFSSLLGQNDADAQAQAAFDAQKQDFANTYGSCSLTPPVGNTVWNPMFSPDGCFLCTMVSRDDPSDVRAATSDEIARYYREITNTTPFGYCPACF